MDKIMKNRIGLKLVTGSSSDYKEVHKISFISYILLDQVRWCNVKRFLCYSKITSTNLCKQIHDIINYSFFICSLDLESV